MAAATVTKTTPTVTLNKTDATVTVTTGAASVTVSHTQAVATLASLTDVVLTSPSDNQSLTYDTASGKWINETVAGGAGGDAWSDPVDADIVPDGDGTRDLGATATRFAETYTDALDVTNNITVGGTVDGRDVATDGSKLDGIETAADVTDAGNVSAAGAAMISSGAGAPGSAPAKVGNIYIDTTGDRVYVATDTASSADWDLLPVTAAQVLALLVTVDGTGSGLDADLLDGNEATAFESAGAVSTHAALTEVHGISTFGASLVDDANAATARTTLGVDAAGTDNSTDVTLAGTPDYLTIAGQVITRGLIDLAADVTGDLPLSNLTGASATDTFLARDTAGAGDWEEVTAANARVILNVEDGADVTDTANVTAAGALMDSEVDADIKTLTLPASTTISTYGASLVDDADAATARTTLDVDQAGTDNAPSASATTAGKVELATVAETDTGTDDTRAVTPAGLAGSALQTKVNGIETAADVTDATNVDAAGAVMEADFDANTILAANSDNTPAALTIAEQRLVGRITAGNITGLTAAQVKTLLAIVEADISDLGSYLENISEDTTPQLGGDLDAQGNSVENLGAVEEQVNTVGTSGATETLDVSTYGVHDVTMDQACTFTFSNPAPSGDCSAFTLILRGAFTPTFPASVDWPDGAAPTYTTPTVYVFTTVDAGTTWLGSSPGKAYA